MLPWLLLAAVFAVGVALAIRLILLHRGIDEALSEFDRLISEDTNSLITLSGGDRHLRRLASGLNKSLGDLKRLRRQYQSGDREIRDAVTNISHDLRTPLTAICGYLELLKKEEKSPAAERYIGFIENRTEALKSLTEELFRYSVILSTSEDMAMSRVDASAVLEECVAGFYAAFTDRGIEPKITLPENRVTLNLNRDALSRVFGNILSNALKYSDGDLEIVMEDSGDVRFTNSAENLGEIDVGRLFDRFFSVEAGKNSTGLGLAISKALVEHMGGTTSATYSAGRLTIEISWCAGKGVSED